MLNPAITGEMSADSSSPYRGSPTSKRRVSRQPRPHGLQRPLAMSDIFSDIVNVLLFDGEQRVEENSLVNVAVHSQYKDDKDKLHEQERDVAKYWKERDIEIALYGIENQTEIERRMPLRIFGYEGASYRMQFDKKKVAPVITLVLYFGTEKRWNSSRNCLNCCLR